MGNTQMRDFFQNSTENTNNFPKLLINTSNTELFNHSQFLNDKWSALNIENNKDKASLFDWNNVQLSSFQNVQIEDKLKIQESKEQLLTGILPQECIKDLLNPSLYDETQTFFSPVEVSQFKDDQNKKFLLGNQIYHLMLKMRQLEGSALMSLTDEYHVQPLPKAAEIGIRSGIHLLIALLREVSKGNPNLRDETLNFLIEMFSEVKPLSLWGKNKIDIVLDKSLNKVSDYLEEIIISEDTSINGKKKALTVLFSLGILRGSLTNLLAVVSLLQKINFKIDMSLEFKLLKNEKSDSELKFEKKLKTSSKIFFESKLASGAKATAKSPFLSLTTDGKYIYLHSELEGLLKIGTGYNYTMLGKVYKHKKFYRLKEKSSLVFVNNKLFYRSGKLANGAPFIEIDPETLEESQNKIVFDSSAPNCLFAEMTNPEIEFPHVSQENDEENVRNADGTSSGNMNMNVKEKVKIPINAANKNTNTPSTAQQKKKDLRLMRPSLRSPAFTEGRYIYIASQWTVDSHGSNNDSDDEDEGQKESNFKAAKFGIDIYDPLNNFEHLRSLELINPEQKFMKGSKKKLSPAITSKTLDFGSFTTNGSQILIAIPINTEENPEIRYKYFNLSDGLLQRKVLVKNDITAHARLTYDYNNNLIWGINDNKKTFDHVTCLFNKTIPEKFNFKEDSEFYIPWENDKIIDLALKGLGHIEEESKENKKLDEANDITADEWHVLLNLGYTNEDEGDLRGNYGNEEEEKKKDEENSENKTKQFLKTSQLLILSSIARLADSYSNLTQSHFNSAEDGYISFFRKPYCINLVPKVFNYLEKFLDFYNKNIFDSKECNLVNSIDLGCFLCTLRIIKYNLANLEVFRENFKNKKKVGNVPSQSFCSNLSFLIKKVFKMVKNTEDIDDMRKSIYREALSIYQFNLSIIFPSMNKILNVLRKNLLKSNKSELKREKCLAILNYLKNQRAIWALVSELIDENNLERMETIKIFSDLVNFINSAEISAFCGFLGRLNENNFLELKYKEDVFIKTCTGFLIEVQKEIFYRVGNKLSDKSIENHPIMEILSDFSDSICRHAILINESLENSFKMVLKKIDINSKEKVRKFEEEQKKKKKKKIIKLKDVILEGRFQFWDRIMEFFDNKVYFSQILLTQINFLNLFSSNFLIAARTLGVVTKYMNSLNKLYAFKKDIKMHDNEGTKNKQIVLDFESDHPRSLIKLTKKEKVHIPGARYIRVNVDVKSDFKGASDYLSFYSDEGYSKKIVEKINNNTIDIYNDFFVNSDTFYYSLNLEQSKNLSWGYKFTAQGFIANKSNQDSLNLCHRNVCWLAGKCAGQLVNGSALQQQLSAHFLPEEESKYSVLLNSKLFSGGIEKCYFSAAGGGTKESVYLQLGEIINEFGAGYLSEYLSSEMNVQEREQENILNHIIRGDTHPKVQNLLACLQKQFSRECLWANLGGAKAEKLVRGAFAVIIKHAGLTYDFMDTAEKLDEFLPGDKNNTMRSFVKKWQAASRMRTWLVEKRKDIDDLAERNRMLQKQISDVAKKKKEIEEKKIPENNRGEEMKMDLKEEQFNLPEEQKEEVPISENLQVQNTEDIVQKMIDQIIKKSEFLIQLIPAKHWSVNLTEKQRDKQFLLFRTTAEVEELMEKKEEEWKRRLIQWKSVRQSKKGVYKSLEDESKDIDYSLNTSVLTCLQSPVSIRRLKKQVESAYLRAICRTVGLNALTNIISNTPSSIYRQDVVGWLCSSLRSGQENRLYHFTDNLQGCGYYLESAVNTSFKNVIIAIVKSMSRSNNIDEIKTMLEALKWKFHGDDHTFLAEIDLFTILRGGDISEENINGNNSSSLLRSAWGKYFEKISMKFYYSNIGGTKMIDGSLVKKLLELFEIIIVLCIGKIKEVQENLIDKKNDVKSITLEKHSSQIDEYSAEILIRQAFSVIFIELTRADENYRKFKGIDWGAWTRAKDRAKRRQEIDKKANKKAAQEKLEIEYLGKDLEYYLDQVNEEEMNPDIIIQNIIQEREEEEKKNVNEHEEEFKKEEDENDFEFEDYDVDYGEVWDLKTMKAMNKVEKKEVNPNENKQPTNKSHKKFIKSLIQKEEKEIITNMDNLYNPEFLFRLLILVYKCCSASLDQVSVVLGSPKYIKVLFRLLQSTSPIHRNLIIQILSTLLKTLPSEIFCDALLSSEKGNPNSKLKENTQFDELSVIEYFFQTLKQIRKKSFMDNIEFHEEYTVSSELVSLFRDLLGNSHTSAWQKPMTKFLKNTFSNGDSIDKIIVVSIVGGEINGLRNEGLVNIATMEHQELYETNVLLKDNLDENYEVGTIVGFSSNYREKVPDAEKTAANEIFHSIGSPIDMNNPVVLIQSSINKKMTNLNGIELTAINRCLTIPIDKVAFSSGNFSLEENSSLLINLFAWALESENLQVYESKLVHLKCLAVKCLSSYLNSDVNVQYLITNKPEILQSLVKLACSKIITQNSIMSLELTEEKLFRMLRISAETELNLNDLKDISAGIRSNNELCILLGKEYTTIKYPIKNAFNIDKICTEFGFTELVNFQDIFKNPGNHENKAVLINIKDIMNKSQIKILNNCKFVITYDFDMELMAELTEGTSEIRKLMMQNAQGGLSNASSKNKNRKKENIQGGENSSNLVQQQQQKVIEEELLAAKEQMKEIINELKGLNIVNILYKYFAMIEKQIEEQKFQEQKNFYRTNQLSDDLIELGFPPDVVEEYFKENPMAASPDIIVNEIIKLVEIKRQHSKDLEETNKRRKKEEEKLDNALGLNSENLQEKKIKQNEEEIEENFFEQDLEKDEENKVQIEKAEREEPNICFKCKGEKDFQKICEKKNKLYDLSVDTEKASSLNKVIIFKQTNHNLSIYNARRAVLSLLELWPKKELSKNFILKSAEIYVPLFKLLTFEGIFSSNTFCNNKLLVRVSKLMIKYFDEISNEKIISDFIDKIFEKCVLNPIFALEEKFSKKKEEKTTKNLNEENNENRILYNGKINDENEMDIPFLDFSLKLAELFIKSNSHRVYAKMLRFDLLFSLLGIATIINDNKELLWGLMLFIMKFTDFLDKKRDNFSSQEINLLQNKNLQKFHKFLNLCKNSEGDESSLSKRTQIATELLIFLNKLQRNIVNDHEKLIIKLGESGIDLQKFMLIEELSDVVDVMQNYEDNKTLIASTWLDSSINLIKKEKKVIDGDHFYSKSLHSYKMILPYASEVTINFSEETQTDPGDSIIISSDPNGENSVQKFSGHLSKEVRTFPSGTFYIHFPAKGSEIYSFGRNEKFQLGTSATHGNGPFCLEQYSSANVAQIDCGDFHSSLVTKDGDLISCGSGNQTGQSLSSIAFTKISFTQKVLLLSCGSNFTIFYTENSELHGMGSNLDGRCGLASSVGTAYPQKLEFSKFSRVHQISCGFDHSILCSKEGKLFVTGSNNFGQLGIEDTEGNKVAKVSKFKLVENISSKKVLMVAAGSLFSLIMVRDRNNKISVLSCGDKSNGKLGLGNINNNMNQFTVIQELKDKGVNSIFIKKKHSIALTNSGRVYTWGSNEFGQCGQGNFEDVEIPKLVTFFDKLKVMNAAVGSTTTIFIVKTQNEDTTHVYACGENENNCLCLNNNVQKEYKEKIASPILVEYFEKKNPIRVVSGTNFSFVIMKNTSISNMRDLFRQTCSICKKTTILNGICVDPFENSNYYCYPCISEIKSQKSQKKLLYFCRENFEGKEFTWPKIELDDLNSIFSKETENWKGEFNRNCTICEKSICKVMFINIHESEFLECICEHCALSINELHVSNTIYYRITSPLHKNANFNFFPRSYFFNQSDTYGYHMTFTPKFSEKGHNYMVSKYAENYLSFSAEFKNMHPETDEQLVDLVNNLAQKKEKKVIDLDSNIIFPKEELNIRSALEMCSNEFLKKRFMILKNFNNRVMSIMNYIDFSAKKGYNRLRNIYSNSSIYIFWDVKSDLFEKILNVGSKSAPSNIKIKVNRMKASKFIQKGLTDHTSEFTVFGQLYQYFKHEGYQLFMVKKDENPFSVQFIGEASIDIGGPYREAISQICSELQSSALPLLLPSPNQKNDSGQFREKWVLNPSANTLIHTKMYKFLGVIMGCSIRTKNFLNLDLPSIIWKQLVDSPVTRKDLENIDRYTIQCLDDVINIQKKGVDQDNFNDLIQEKFVTYLCDGTEVELYPGGKLDLVTFEKRTKYASLVEEVRKNEFNKQAEALRSGLTIIIPEGLLNLLTWRELETLVCGKPILDVDLLRQNTIYRGCNETDNVIMYFWRALTEFSPDERSMYLRFVFGRSRLPLTSKDFPMKHQIEILRKFGVENDIMLPIAHTCFFSIEIPKYSIYEILRDKLKYAITHCQAIDTDGRTYDIWDDDDDF